jgi:hypothetical protein
MFYELPGQTKRMQPLNCQILRPVAASFRTDTIFWKTVQHAILDLLLLTVYYYGAEESFSGQDEGSELKIFAPDHGS